MPSSRDTSDDPTDFRPIASWRNLQLRADLLRRLREFFHQAGFLEVETPILSAETVVDRHLDPFTLPGEFLPCWLQTSPEAAMKRLLATEGCPKAIYQISRVFRRDEQGPLHNPEFTLVEWYRRGDSLDDGMGFTSDLCEAMLRRGSALRLSYGEAFRQYAGLDPHAADTAELMEAARKLAKSPPPESLAADDRDGWLDWLLTERVQPHLGIDRPVLLYDYPATQAALARVRPGRPPLAERFELYVSGIELANGYHELLDAGELRRRNAAVNARRQADGKAALPEPGRLLAAMEAGLPPAVGVALGWDRLVMLAAGAADLREVIAFPFDRA
jgi:lysyl-tRNA synthetase class 2